MSEMIEIVVDLAPSVIEIPCEADVVTRGLGYLLKEDGGALLKEDGGLILIER